jgi:hypothetical protein
VGIIARDCMGCFLGARSLAYPLWVDTKTTETMAALGAVQFIKEVGFFDAIFEGGAAQVISKINSGPPYLSRLGQFLESIHMDKQFLHSCTFSFMSRNANSAAQD